LPSITVHNRRHFLDSFTLRLTYDVAVNLKGRAGVGVS
jgi:hypothetical protein